VDLRPELLPAPVAPERIAQLAAAITRIADLLDRGEPCSDVITAFNADTGGEYTPHDFHVYDEWGSAETFAHLAARPRYPRVPDITREELVEIARRIMAGPGPQAGDPDADWYTLLFDTNITRPGASALIFDPPAGLGPDPTPQQIVATALDYRPTAL
jgi:hypothetical protein